MVIEGPRTNSEARPADKAAEAELELAIDQAVGLELAIDRVEAPEPVTVPEAVQELAIDQAVAVNGRVPKAAPIKLETAVFHRVPALLPAGVADSAAVVRAWPERAAAEAAEVWAGVGTVAAAVAVAVAWAAAVAVAAVAVAVEDGADN